MKKFAKKQNFITRLFRNIKHHSLAWSGFCILAGLYILFTGAEFFAPYHYTHESRNNTYNPPTRIHFWKPDGSFSFVPYFYNSFYTFNEVYKRVYQEDTSKIYYLKLFAKGDPYKFWGIIPGDIHLFGTEPGGLLYLCGADYRGRDIVSRLIYGSRISLSIGFIGVFISYTIALFVGGIAGYYGRWIDTVLMRITEMIMIIPVPFLLLSLRASFPLSLSSLQVYILITVIMSFIYWAPVARVMRGMTKSIRERDFILAAEALGQHTIIIIFKHIIPQTFSYIIIGITMSIPSFILGESALSFLGLGIQDPYTSWGNMLTDAFNIADIKHHPWILIPGFLIFITVLSYNLLGDGLRDFFDVKSSKIS